jgi:iron complex transport system ATP-binding protein
LASLRSAAERTWGSGLLQAADIVFGYGRAQVLRGVSVSIPSGGFVGILGPNGSGKTTLLKVLAGTLRAAGGRVTLDGRAIADVPRTALARRMAVVPQETHLAFDYSVLEVVLMGRYPHLGAFEVEGPGDFTIAREALAATGTLDFEDRAFETLSGGEKQRVIIAAALAQIDATRHRSSALAAAAESILLLDEPTAALDLAYQIELAALLRDLQARLPITVVVSTHDLNFAASLCRSLVLLKSGAVLASGNTDDVLTPENVRQLYGVHADVHRHASTGRLVVVPLGRAADGPRS